LTACFKVLAHQLTDRGDIASLRTPHFRGQTSFSAIRYAVRRELPCNRLFTTPSAEMWDDDPQALILASRPNKR
jgi:hypothetical protein